MEGVDKTLSVGEFDEMLFSGLDLSELLDSEAAEQAGAIELDPITEYVLSVVSAIEGVNMAKGNQNTIWETVDPKMLFLMQSASNDPELPVLLIKNNVATPPEIIQAVSRVATTIIEAIRFGVHNHEPTLMIEFSRITSKVS